jgi:hypothetical protein
MSKLKKLDLPLSIESCGWRFMEKYPLPTISVPLALLLHDSFTGWRDISKVELKGIDALDADSMERIKEKYKKDKSVSINKGGKMIRVDKSLCVYLNGQNVYPAAHIVKKKEETISLKPEKETREALEKKKKEMSEKLEDMTLAALCESKLGALGFDYRYNAKENFVKVVIKKRFIIGYKLTLTGSQEDISFLADVASSFRDALQGCNEEKVKLTAHDHGEYDGVNIGCPINDSNNTLILGLEPDAISVGLEAMLSFSSSLILLQQKYGEKMNSIEYYND